MATTTTKTETLVGKRIRRKRRSAPDHRHRDLRRRYQDAGHAPRLHRAQPARARRRSSRINMKPRARASRRGRGVHRRGYRRTSARCPAALRCPACACRITTSWRSDRVYFVGHPVAVVVATDRYIARDAADPIEVEYEPLPAVADPEKALAPGAPAVHPEWPDNIAFTYHQEGGDVGQGVSPTRKWWSSSASPASA